MRCSYLDTNIHDTLKPRRGRSYHVTFAMIEKRVAAIADRYSLDMQNVRFQLIFDLKALAELAQQKAIDVHPQKEEVKQSWIRLAAYLGQVINGIGKTFEEVKLDEDLKELEDLVKKAKEQVNQNAQQEPNDISSWQ